MLIYSVISDLTPSSYVDNKSCLFFIKCIFLLYMKLYCVI